MLERKQRTEVVPGLVVSLHHEQGSRSEGSEGDFNLIAIRCLGSDPGMIARCRRGDFKLLLSFY